MTPTPPPCRVCGDVYAGHSAEACIDVLKWKLLVAESEVRRWKRAALYFWRKRDEKEDCPLCIAEDLEADLLEACIPFANEATLYLLENLTYRCACCNAEPQNVPACDFEHRSDCPVVRARAEIAKAEGK